MNYSLPERVEIGGHDYPVRWDYRAVLDILEALGDSEYDGREKGLAALVIFYPDLEKIPPERYEEAVERCLWFVNGGEAEEGRKSPRLVDWSQDFPRIAAPVSRVVGRDIRSPEPLHWWTFLSAYMEIGDCLFAQIVGIRSKRARHKQLDKSEREFYRNNRELIDFKRKYTAAEDDLITKWTQ